MFVDYPDLEINYGENQAGSQCNNLACFFCFFSCDLPLVIVLHFFYLIPPVFPRAREIWPEKNFTSPWKKSGPGANTLFAPFPLSHCHCSQFPTDPDNRGSTVENI